MRKSVTVKAAWIGGICVIIASIIGLFKCPNTNSVNNISSHGQNGGITAQNVTVNNYFEKQTPEEKKEVDESLITKYPLGYIKFSGNGKTIHIPESSSFIQDNIKDLANSKISLQKPELIELYLPKSLDTAITNITEDDSFNKLNIPRKIGLIKHFPIEYFPVEHFPKWHFPEGHFPMPPEQAKGFDIEVLDDRESFVVLVIGFTE
jgi:hypothetical protein